MIKEFQIEFERGGERHEIQVTATDIGAALMKVHREHRILFIEIKLIEENE